MEFNYEGLKPSSSKPLIGMLCSYSPEEILYAAGLQPVRIYGSGKTIKRGDAYLYSTLCPYVRSIFDLAFEGHLNDFKNMVFVNSCDAMRRLYDVWRHYIKNDFIHILDLPRATSEDKLDYYVQQLRDLIRRLEEEFRVDINPDSLREAIRLVNHTRQLFHDLFQLRKKDDSNLWGSQIFPIMLASMSTPKESFNQMLEQYIEEVSRMESHPSETPRPRLLVSGSIVEQTEFIKLLEDSGARVVAEDLCTGIRSLEGMVQEEGDPVEAIARRYLNRPPCSRMKGVERRYQFIKQIIEEYGIHGVVYHTIKFCDPELMTYPLLRKELERENIPVLHLEGDCTMGSYGQMKTRVGAFIEMLEY
ncbi:MAG: 2-hydroxyacyl-CoA dehydratase family protein [Desulfobacteria bacterium]|jgi:bcr-type benzoyl-CoA reductase subunit C